MLAGISGELLLTKEIVKLANDDVIEPCIHHGVDFTVHPALQYIKF